MNFEKNDITNLPNKSESKDFSDTENIKINNDRGVENATKEIKEFFIESATQYLDKEEDKYLKDQIIKFYSDEERLKTELTEVFRDVDEEEISKKIKEAQEKFGNKEAFIDYVTTKNFATSPEERVLEEERIKNIYQANDQKQLEEVRAEISLESQDQWKGVDFWTKEIEAAGALKKLKFFNDVITEKKAPQPDSGYGEPVLKNVILDGKKVDVYHSDNKPGLSMNRLFLHIKE